jgi:hypothetical protein
VWRVQVLLQGKSLGYVNQAKTTHVLPLLEASLFELLFCTLGADFDGGLDLVAANIDYHGGLFPFLFCYLLLACILNLGYF